MFASKSTPGVALPELLLSRPSEFSGAEEISYTFWLSNCAATWVFFSLGLSGESAPVHWQRLAFVASVRSKKKKNKNSEKKVRRRAEIRCQWQRLEEESFQGASIMLYTYTRITCRYGLDKPINHTITTSKNTPVVHFSAFVDLATEISAILPLWRLKLSVYFHLGEYYWSDFSSPALNILRVLGADGFRSPVCCVQPKVSDCTNSQSPRLTHWDTPNYPPRVSQILHILLYVIFCFSSLHYNSITTTTTKTTNKQTNQSLQMKE